MAPPTEGRCALYRKMKRAVSVDADRATKKPCLGLTGLSSAELIKLFTDVVPTLQDIKHGKVQSDLHIYSSGSCKKLNELRNRSNAICCVTAQQYNEIAEFLIEKFCSTSSSVKSFSYTMDVLYPEGIVLVLMNYFHIGKQEAKLMMTTSYTESTSHHQSDDLEPVSSYKRRQDLYEYVINKRNIGPIYPFLQLLEATENKSTSNLLGEGGFGSVYKGVLRHTTVAVKFLNKDGSDSLGRLTAELTALTKVRHPNIVSVMGFSASPTRAIVYEYVSGGSLFNRLHELKGGPLLQWNDRTRILEDTCRGLVYLHSATPPIVHQDIKSHNILIDAHESAKICDFGFAIELPSVRADGRSMFTAKSFARSEGYYPSELTSGQYSAKSDVYSYGVVMLETFTKMKAFSQEREHHKLVDHLEDELKSMDLFKHIQDESLDQCEDDTCSFLFKTINRCLSRHSRRPSSSEVMEAWESQD